MPLGHKYISRKRNASGGYDYVYPHPTTGEHVRVRTSLRLDGEHRSVTAENPEDRTLSATAWSRRGADGKTLTETHSALDEAEAPIHLAAVADTMNRKKTITRLSHKTSSYGEKDAGPVYPFWVRNQKTGSAEGFKTREQADIHLRHYVKNPENHVIEQVGAKGPKVNVDHLLSGNMGIPRIEMPQIRSFKLPEFLSKLEKKGIKATKGERAVGSLKPTQNEIHGERVQEIIEDPKERENLAKQIIISNDGFILDGHHRWAALTTIDPKAKIKTLHVDMPMRSLLKEAHAFEGVEYQKSAQETDMGGDLIDNLELLAKGDTLVGFYSPGVARGGKYYRRVPTGNPKHPWRYFYTEAEYKDALKDSSHVGGVEAKRARVKKRVFVSEKEAREKYGLPGTTKELHAPDGNYPAERKKLHEEIISHFLDGKGTPPAGKKPVALLTVGGPAAGKSTLLKHLGENLDDYVMIAADDVKEKLPEFQRALNLGNRKVKQPDGSVTSVPVTASHSGWMAHDESTDISDELEKRVIASGKSAIFDGTGKNVPKMLAKIAALKKAGYHVRVVMPHVPMGEAIKRLHSRSEDTGRTLPVDAAIDMHRKIPGNFEAIARAADDFSLFKSGNPPKPIWTGGAGQEDKIHDHEEMSKFNLARGLHQDIGAEEKAGGIYKKSEDPEALDATGPKQPHHTMDEFMEILSRWNGSIDNHEDGRSKVPHDGDIEDGLADVIPDAEEETVKHLKRREPKAKKAKGARFMERGEVEKSGDLIDDLELLAKGGEAAGHKYVSRKPNGRGGYDYVYAHPETGEQHAISTKHVGASRSVFGAETRSFSGDKNLGVMRTSSDRPGQKGGETKHFTHDSITDKHVKEMHEHALKDTHDEKVQGAASKPQKHYEVGVHSTERYRGGASEQRAHGGQGTVTKFSIHDPNKPGGQEYHSYVGHGATPAARKAHAMKQHAEKHGITQKMVHSENPRAHGGDVEKSDPIDALEETIMSDMFKGGEAAGHKYKSRRPDGKGGWIYDYGSRSPSKKMSREERQANSRALNNRIDRHGPKEGPQKSLAEHRSAAQAASREARASGTSEAHERARTLHLAAAQAAAVEGEHAIASRHRTLAADHAAKIQKSERDAALMKGLYQFQGSGTGEVPDQYLYDYLCAFVEEAYEHERQEKVHQNALVPPSSTGASIEDVWATAVFSELVSMMGSNANLKRAAVKYNVTKDVIAHILRSKGLVRPFSDAGTWTTDYDSMRAMDGEGVTRPLVLSESARAQYRDIVPDPFGHNVGVALAKAEPAPTAPLFIDDSHDPHGNLAKAERARLALVDYRQNAEWRPNVSPTCMIHGSADLTKSMNLSNPHARCTCPR